MYIEYRFLFQPDSGFNSISIIDLKLKKVRRIERSCFRFPKGKAFIHVKEDYYLAGGYTEGR